MGRLESRAIRRARAVRFAVLGTVVAIVLATTSRWSSHPALYFLGAAAAVGAAMVVAILPRRHRISFLVVAAVGLPGLTLMEAYSGGVASRYSILTIVAMVWLALDAGDREHLAAIVLLIACCCLPMLVIGAPAYPVSWGSAGLLAVIGATVTGTLRALNRESQALARRMHEEAVIDDLTGLLNRRGWRYAAPQELVRAGRAGNPIALLTLDLDELKRLNDGLGHGEGDRVLQETAARIRATLRAGDVMARIGGDEFVALLTDSTLAGALIAVERLRATTPRAGSFSAGVAIWDRSEELAELVGRSDRALYAAKAAGGGCTEVAAPAPVPGDTVVPSLAAALAAHDVHTPQPASVSARLTRVRCVSSRQTETIAPPEPV
jgi:diguanylate cyclase (GGDEF)-like protein